MTTDAIQVRIDVSQSASEGSGSKTFKMDSTNDRHDGAVHTVTTSDSAIPTGSITTPRRVLLWNLDETNYVDVGPDNAGSIVPLVRLFPRSAAGNESPNSFDLVPSVTARWQANTGSCDVFLLMLDT